ncbi:hypothetical protein EJ08DRAFT_676888 [Tothia fuscella]|uniref:Uncharacterized protein n=1 Tax=Tothia fuscella TaxID=1048955 RepID=A0A9P4NW22_9PEZI|nr:hypothetical protein EJ08DRAFT_676888 [Tothia fuscella]
MSNISRSKHKDRKLKKRNRDISPESRFHRVFYSSKPGLRPNDLDLKNAAESTAKAKEAEHYRDKRRQSEERAKGRARQVADEVARDKGTAETDEKRASPPHHQFPAGRTPPGPIWTSYVARKKKTPTSNHTKVTGTTSISTKPITNEAGFENACRGMTNETSLPSDKQEQHQRTPTKSSSLHCVGGTSVLNTPTAIHVEYDDDDSPAFPGAQQSEPLPVSGKLQPVTSLVPRGKKGKMLASTFSPAVQAALSHALNRAREEHRSQSPYPPISQQLDCPCGLQGDIHPVLKIAAEHEALQETIARSNGIGNSQQPSPTLSDEGYFGEQQMGMSGNSPNNLKINPAKVDHASEPKSPTKPISSSTCSSPTHNIHTEPAPVTPTRSKRRRKHKRARNPESKSPEKVYSTVPIPDKDEVQLSTPTGSKKSKKRKRIEGDGATACSNDLYGDGTIEQVSTTGAHDSETKSSLPPNKKKRIDKGSSHSSPVNPPFQQDATEQKPNNNTKCRSESEPTFVDAATADDRPQKRAKLFELHDDTGIFDFEGCLGPELDLINLVDSLSEEPKESSSPNEIILADPLLRQRRKLSLLHQTDTPHSLLVRFVLSCRDPQNGTLTTFETINHVHDVVKSILSKVKSTPKKVSFDGDSTLYLYDRSNFCHMCTLRLTSSECSIPTKKLSKEEITAHNRPILPWLLNDKKQIVDKLSKHRKALNISSADNLSAPLLPEPAEGAPRLRPEYASPSTPSKSSLRRLKTERKLEDTPLYRA